MIPSPKGMEYLLHTRGYGETEKEGVWFLLNWHTHNAGDAARVKAAAGTSFDVPRAGSCAQHLDTAVNKQTTSTGKPQTVRRLRLMGPVRERTLSTVPGRVAGVELDIGLHQLQCP